MLHSLVMDYHTRLRSHLAFYLTLSLLFLATIITHTRATRGAADSLPRQLHSRHGRHGNRHHGNQGIRYSDTKRGPEEPQQKRELWLEDFSKDYLNEMQSDGVGRNSAGGSLHPGRSGRTGQCPPPFNALPRDACEATPCESDKECHGHHCCYNGCIFTCMAEMPPPPVVDWRKEPPRKESGRSWLLPASNESSSDNGKAEYCSTSRLTNAADALLCPHGYICHIEFLGNLLKGIPNRGRCIPTVHEPSETHKMFQMRTHDSNSNRCIVPGNGIYRNGTRFRYERHMCQCQEGTVTCKVGRG